MAWSDSGSYCGTYCQSSASTYLGFQDPLNFDSFDDPEREFEKDNKYLSNHRFRKVVHLPCIKPGRIPVNRFTGRRFKLGGSKK